MSGHSNSSGRFAVGLTETFKGMSVSSGTTIDEVSVLLMGESLSSGIFIIAEDHHDDFSGGSISSGHFATELYEILKGYSTSHGTLTDELLTALIELTTYVLNLETKRTYQFSNYGFTGIGRFNDVLIGKKGNSIYDLETPATKDDGTAIAALLDFGKLDYGLPNHKEERGVYIEFESGTSVKITITQAGKAARTFTVSPEDMKSLPKDLISKNFAFKIENVSGEQITVKRIHKKINVMEMKGV